MGWAVTDATGKVISVGYDARIDIETDGMSWHVLDDARIRQVMDGTIPLGSALLPDDQLPRQMQVIDDTRHHTADMFVTKIGRPSEIECTFLGKQANSHIWSVICSGFDSRLLDGYHLVVWDWRYNSHQPIHTLFPWNAWNEITAEHGIHKIILVIDSHMEAPNPVVHLEPLAKILCDQGMSKQRLIDWNNLTHDNTSLTTLNIGYAVCVGAGMHITKDPADMPTHHFVMLARQPRPLRVMAAVEIIHRGLEVKGYMSCGINDEDDTSWIERWVPDEYKDRFPIVLDGKIPQIDQLQYKSSDPRIMHAAINVICETSQDAHLTAPRFDWFDPFITEKTAKAFRMCQLPLWIGVKGQVAATRAYGLDVYDDVLDHGYDEIEDPQLRIAKAMDELQRWCDRPLRDVIDVMESLRPRMRANKEMIESRIRHIYPRMSRLLSAQLSSIRAG